MYLKIDYINESIKKYTMNKFKILKSQKQLIYNTLTNSNKLNHTIFIINNILYTNKQDKKITQMLLNFNYIKYKVIK